MESIPNWRSLVVQRKRMLLRCRSRRASLPDEGMSVTAIRDEQNTAAVVPQSNPKEVSVNKLLLDTSNLIDYQPSPSAKHHGLPFIRTLNAAGGGNWLQYLLCLIQTVLHALLQGVGLLRRIEDCMKESSPLKGACDHFFEHLKRH